MSAAGGFGPAWLRTQAWLHQRFMAPSPPTVAIEVRARSLGIVRLARERGRLRLASAVSLELPEGALRISMVEPNVIDAAAFRAALSSAVERAGVLGAGRVALVLPDPVARVAVFPAAEVQGRAADRDELLRFRLRKSVPFDVREARVAAVTLLEAAEPTLLAGAVFAPVLEGYEAACRSLGLEPGLVELAGLALHGAMSRGRAAADRLLVNWDDGYLSLVLSRAGAPVLVRTLTGEPAARPAEVAREVANTVLYYRERLGGTGLAGAAVRSATRPPAETVALLEEPLGLVPDVIDPWAPFGGGPVEVSQALAGAMACIGGRAA